jgi:fimbrial chaperone protein
VISINFNYANKFLCKLFFYFLALHFLLFFFLTPAHAVGIKMDRTRIVYYAGVKGEKLGVKNTSNHAWLVQASVVDRSGKEDDSMFVTPPLFRLEPLGENFLRVVSLDEERRPSDRESLKFMYINAIPSSSPLKSADSQLAVGIAMSIKIFLRPESLASPGEKVWKSITWYKDRQALKGCNTSPYFLSFNRLTFNGESMDLNNVPSMLSPFECVFYGGQGEVKDVHWSLINDYGGDSGWYAGKVSEFG